MKSVRTVTKLLAASGEARTIKFELSNSLEDRAGDTVNAAGWRLDNYLANPIVLWGHDSDDLPVGRMLSVGSDGTRLVGEVQFADADTYEFADTVYRLTKGGYLNAGSVGFRPLRWEINANGGLDFLEQELLEFSIVTIPCNPHALVNAKSAGVNLSPLGTVLRAAPSERFTELRTALDLAERPADTAKLYGRRAREVALSASKLRLAR